MGLRTRLAALAAMLYCLHSLCMQSDNPTTRSQHPGFVPLWAGARHGERAKRVVSCARSEALQLQLQLHAPQHAQYAGI